MGTVSRATPPVVQPKPKIEIGKKQDKTFTGPAQDPDRDGPSIAALNQALAGAANEFNQLWSPYEDGWLAAGQEPVVNQEDGTYTGEFLQFDALLPEWANSSSVWGQVQQTSSAEVHGAMGGLPSNSLLYVAFGPENLPKLDLAEEVTALQGGIDNLVVVWNPSRLALRMLTGSGKFNTAIVAGHGADGGGGVYMTDGEGKALPTPASEFAAFFQGTSISTVFLNACNGLEGEDSVASALNEVGVSVLGWVETVKDDDAIAAAEQLASLGDAIEDGASPQELQQLANAFDGAGGNLVASVVEDADSIEPAAIIEAAREVFPAPTPPAATTDVEPGQETEPGQEAAGPEQDPFLAALMASDPYYSANYAFYGVA